MFSFTPYSPSDDPQELIDAGLGAPLPEGVTIGEVTYTGVDGQSSIFTEDDDVIGISGGFLLTTGDGTPPTSNTVEYYAEVLNTPGDSDLTDVVEVAFPGAGGTYDANVIEFVVNVDNPEVEGISFDLVFGSDEYPEYVESFVDIAGVFVNGVNVANFDDDPQRPLSVIPSNLQYFRDNDGSPDSPPGSENLPIEYDGVSILLQTSAPLKQGENVIKIAIADTGDLDVDSGLFVGNIRFVGDVGGGGLNVPPVANNDAYVTDEDKPLVLVERSVLDNDTDFDEDPLTAVLASGPDHGTVVLDSDGTFSYTPDANFHGTDTFTYEALDGNGGRDTGTVTITVNPVADPPNASDDDYTVAVNGGLKVGVEDGVLGNDRDPDGGALRAVVVNGPSHGTLVLNANGSFTYVPESGFAGEDIFTYAAVDPQGNRDTASVAINVVSSGTPPVIESIDTEGLLREGSPIDFTVYAYDQDEEGDLRYAFDFDGDGIADATNVSGMVVHTFDDDGQKNVVVRVTDSNGNVASETVRLDIANVAPVVTLDEEPGVDGGKVTISGTVADPGTGDTFELVIDWGEPGPGRFQTILLPASPSGSQTFEATHAYSGSGDFAIRATVTDDDGGRGVDQTQVSLVNQEPTLWLDPVEPIDENGTAVLTGTVNDPDPGDKLTLTVNWGDKTTVETIEADDLGTGFKFRLTHVYRDDQPTVGDLYFITAVVEDGNGGYAEMQRGIEVRNVAPEIDSGTRAEIPDGGPVSYSQQVDFSGSYTDRGPLDEHDITIRWGDGKATSTIKNPGRFQMSPDGDGGTRFKTTHNYAEGGIYRIATIVDDDDGGTGVKRQNVFVSGMRLADTGEIQIIADRDAANVYLFTDRGPSEFAADGVGAAPAGNNLVVVNSDIKDGTDRTYDRASVERVFFRGSAEGDTFVTFDGTAGETELQGRGGNDDLRGGSSRDLIKGGNGSDILFGQLGRDTIDGGPGSDLIFGDFDEPGIGNNDVLFGRKGDDTVIGGGGNDEISGDLGRDWLAGGFGQDTVLGGKGADVMFGDDDTFLPEYGPLVGREGGPSALRVLPGGELPNVVSRPGDGADVMDGGEGNDLMYGQGGNDEMSGGLGDDTIVGGPGDDVLRLGGGRNVVVFDRGDGRDTVYGFGAGPNVIDLRELDRAVIEDAADVIARARAVEGGVVLDLGGGDQIHLVGVTLTSLTEDAFLV